MAKQRMGPCCDCGYWSKADHIEQRIGECRRFPPVLIDMNQRLVGNLPSTALRTAYPVTHEGKSCGEFTPA